MRLKFKPKDDKPNTPAWLESLLAKRESLIKPFADISLPDIRKTFESLNENYPPVLSLDQAAKLAHLAPSTLKRKVSEGHFKESVKRGMRISRIRLSDKDSRVRTRKVARARLELHQPQRPVQVLVREA